MKYKFSILTFYLHIIVQEISCETFKPKLFPSLCAQVISPTKTITINYAGSSNPGLPKWHRSYVLCSQICSNMISANVACEGYNFWIVTERCEFFKTKPVSFNISVECFFVEKKMPAIDCSKDDISVHITNHAVNKIANTIPSAANANRTIDGNPNPDWYGYSCFNAFGTVDDKAWLAINMKNTFLVKRIEIINRNDCCSERLTGTIVSLSLNAVAFTDPNSIVNSLTKCSMVGNATDRVTINLRCNPCNTAAQYVILTSTTISLCEISVFGPPVKGSCPEGFVKSNVTNACYYMGNELKSWMDSSQACTKVNAYLAVIESLEEMNHFESFLDRYRDSTLCSSNNTFNFVWVGGNGTGTLRWMMPDGSSPGIPINMFGSGEPNGSGAQCVNLLSNLNDDGCGGIRCYVCKKLPTYSEF